MSSPNNISRCCEYNKHRTNIKKKGNASLSSSFHCDSQANNNMTYECLLSCTQALFFGNSYLLKEPETTRKGAKLAKWY